MAALRGSACQLLRRCELTVSMACSTEPWASTVSTCQPTLPSSGCQVPANFSRRSQVRFGLARRHPRHASALDRCRNSRAPHVQAWSDLSAFAMSWLGMKLTRIASGRPRRPLSDERSRDLLAYIRPYDRVATRGRHRRVPRPDARAQGICGCTGFDLGVHAEASAARSPPPYK